MVFNISVANFINLIAICIGIGICSLNLFQVSAGNWLRKEVKRYFQIFFGSVLLYIIMHLARQTMEGIEGDGIRIALYIVTFAEFLASGIMAYLISLLILNVSKAKNTKVTGLVITALLILHTVLLIVAQFSNTYYYFDGQNIYHRAGLYIISNVPQILTLGLDIYLLICYRKNIRRRVKISLWIYLILPLVAILLQSIAKDIQFIIISTIIGAGFMFTTIMRDQIEQYEKQRAESNRMETELNMASAIQADMLPNIFPAFPEREDFDVYASMNPAKEVGGDFYDFFLIDDTHLGIVMADVSDKGVPAALFMMISKILVQNYSMIKNSAAATLEAVNNQICLNNREEMFVTVWLGIMDLKTGKITAANAGHEYPVIYHPNGQFDLIRDKHGLVIGAMKDIKYREYEIQMKPGSKLFLYTDGLPEATNKNAEQFGNSRMVQSLNKALDKTPKEILESVTSDVNEFVSDAPQFDDLTMLCLHYKGYENSEK